MDPNSKDLPINQSGRSLADFQQETPRGTRSGKGLKGRMITLISREEHDRLLAVRRAKKQEAARRVVPRFPGIATIAALTLTPMLPSIWVMLSM